MIEETDIFLPVFFLTHNKLTLFLLIICLFPIRTAEAISVFKVQIETVKNNTATLSKAKIKFRQATAKRQLSLSAGKLKLHGQQDLDLKDIHFDCENLFFKAKNLTCDNGRLSALNRYAIAKNSPVNFSFDPAKNAVLINISDINLLSGKLSTQISSSENQLKSIVNIKRVKLSADSLASVYKQNPKDRIDFNSMLSGLIHINLINEKLDSTFNLSINGLSFSNSSGEIIGEGINSHLQGNLEQTRTGHKFKKINISFKEGELLTPFFYSNFTQRPLDLQLRKVHVKPAGNWQLQSAQAIAPYFQIEAKNLTANTSQIESGSIHLDDTNLKKIYSFYFEPVITKELAQLNVEGIVSGHLTLENQAISDYNLQLSNINFEHAPTTGNKKYFFKNINGQLNNTVENKIDSYLAFETASLFEVIEFGSTHIPLHTTNQSISISEPSELSVFDGKLIIEKFSLDISDALPKVDFKGLLTPVSLPLITQAMGWPIMQGKISGIIPAVSYQQRNAKLDGTLLIRVFDGNILLKDVQASHLLSAWPVLKADLEFNKIDLEQLTQTFEFGRITGNIDGQINNLVLENWKPTQFDASFKTSSESGKKRISQKAVDNISNLGGGGVAGALSRSFLQFFEDFGYDQLGFSCKLRNGICQMDGVAKANQGYYLVKGGGIPRIDVIGHNQQTDWNILVDRLISITETGTPSIQ